MTTEQINVALADRMGWTCVSHNPPNGMRPHGLPPYLKVSDFSTLQILEGEVPIQPILDYCGDLNAIHAVVKGMTREQRFAFHHRLNIVCVDDFNEDRHWSPNPIDATAEQRARAAVYAFGLEGA
jgi:hypothetical protein